MSKGPQKVRGTQDMIGAEAERFHKVVDAFDRVRRLYAFQHVEVPVFEATEVFARTLGESTDVVSKEMYTFLDRGGDSLTLRPEFTAGICRAFITDGWQQFIPMKIATWGAAFRYERPQKGRFRQFHQLDAEIIGTDSPAADVELIAMAAQLIDELGIPARVELKLNTLGDPATREAWRAALVEHFAAREADLSEESRERLEKNPLRILDSKQHQDFPVVDSAPVIDDFLTAEAADVFGAVTASLDRIGIKWTRDARLVRGLDYYRHTTFEFVTEDLGAQSQVIGGGRYDGLIETMGGPTTPAVGWAAGIERLAMMLDAPEAERIELVFIPVEAEAEAAAREAMAALRRRGVIADMAFRGNMKKRLQRADAAGAMFAVFISQERWARGEVEIKDLETGAQEAVGYDPEWQRFQSMPPDWNQEVYTRVLNARRKAATAPKAGPLGGTWPLG
jgi:histidyl-tRNA synthetase